MTVKWCVCIVSLCRTMFIRSVLRSRGVCSSCRPSVIRCRSLFGERSSLPSTVPRNCRRTIERRVRISLVYRQRLTSVTNGACRPSVLPITILRNGRTTVYG
eukprot:Blabericola_migrator_1__4149@NODE_2268_length_3032_cov_214_380438_g1396_i1_p6_GENE_NODE_2268_length_3032_cov_214_380438_g1396_i1NODE_2268_length_3032_cov_214_380438_g1396_i1_p6_ORF_typecomplete_len102_score14_94zfRING_4/PF14570_6/0_034_NODE_2268_length_3032_cov_214_380438_g1396_i116541959